MKVIRNFFVGSSLVLGMSSFSFRRMPLREGISYNIVYEKTDNTLKSSDDLSEKNLCFLYLGDDHTLSRLYFHEYFDFRNKVEHKEIFRNFLQGKFEYGTNYWQVLEGINNYEYKTNTCQAGTASWITFSWNPKLLGFRYFFNFKRSLTSLSGVQIDNIITKNDITCKEKGKVVLSMNGKSVDLKTALLKHFDSSLSDQYSPLNEYLKNSGYDLELLRESEILAVWDLIAKDVNLKDEGEQQKEVSGGYIRVVEQTDPKYFMGDRIDDSKDFSNTFPTIQRQIMGLARDKNNKLFHWIAELGEDVKCLMLHAKPDRE